MKPDHFVIRYGEIGIKGGNKPYFQKLLMKSIKAALKNENYESMQLSFSRVILNTGKSSDSERIKLALSHVFGVENFSPAWSCLPNIKDMEKLVVAIAMQSKEKTFRITSSRAWKGFSMDSRELNNKLGKAVSDSGKKVNLKNPGLNIEVSLLRSKVLVFTERFPGPGGLPTGSSGKVISLISGGIDSPVSTYMMMKRGCKAILVHFYNENLGSPDLVKEIANKLCQYQQACKLYLVPFADCQKEVISKSPSDYRMILYRRMMLRISEEISRKERAGQLVVGDSLGQVASQTLENMKAISEAVTTTIYRPLIGFDKREIISLAEKLGTFELSIRPYQDCCSFMIDRHPVTKAKKDNIEHIEQEIDIKKLVASALNKARTLNMPLE